MEPPPSELNVGHRPSDIISLILRHFPEPGVVVEMENHTNEQEFSARSINGWKQMFLEELGALVALNCSKEDGCRGQQDAYLSACCGSAPAE